MLFRKRRAQWRIFWRWVVNFLRAVVLKKEHLLPVVTVIHLTHKCNANCTGCSQARALTEQKHPELELEQWHRILRELFKVSPALYISGGEPTLSPLLVPVLKLARTMGFWPIVVNTNGLALERHPEVLQYADRTVVSMHSASLTRASRIMGVNPLRLRRVILALPKLVNEARKHGNQLNFNCPLSGHNIDSVAHLVSFASRLGVGISFTTSIVNHQPEVLSHDAMTQQKFRCFVELLQRLKKKVPGLILNSREQLKQMYTLKPFDCRPSCLLTVNPDGTVQSPCTQKYDRIPEILGSLLKQPTSQFLSPQLDYTQRYVACPGNCCKTCFLAPALSLRHPWSSFWTYLG
jgi:MoaA/NifB/PqqE/SkfB family radical SAM enzyme